MEVGSQETSFGLPHSDIFHAVLVLGLAVGVEPVAVQVHFVGILDELRCHANATVITVPKVVGIAHGVPRTRIELLDISAFNSMFAVVGGRVIHGSSGHSSQSFGHECVDVDKVFAGTFIGSERHLLVDIRVGLTVEIVAARRQQETGQKNSGDMPDEIWSFHVVCF